jgi:hypothetical protein
VSLALNGSRVAFESRDFLFFQCVRGSRVLATEMVAVAAGWQLYDLTARPAALGCAGQFLPGILLFLVAGHCCDRFSRRNILMACFARMPSMQPG